MLNWPKYRPRRIGPSLLICQWQKRLPGGCGPYDLDFLSFGKNKVKQCSWMEWSSRLQIVLGIREWGSPLIPNKGAEFRGYFRNQGGDGRGLGMEAPFLRLVWQNKGVVSPTPTLCTGWLCKIRLAELAFGVFWVNAIDVVHRYEPRAKRKLRDYLDWCRQWTACRI